MNTKCPNCSGELFESNDRFKCRACGSSFSQLELDELRADLAKRQAAFAQRPPVANHAAAVQKTAPTQAPAGNQKAAAANQTTTIRSFKPTPRTTKQTSVKPNATTQGADLNREMCGADLFATSINGVMEIMCFEDGEHCCSGSGSMITPDGYALTNAHVVIDGDGVFTEILVHIAGEDVPATVEALGKEPYMDEGVDLALLKLDYVPDNAIALPFGDFSKVRIGETVYTIGNSKGEGTCITRGIISDIERGEERLFMTDCSTNPGNSGGPVFNEDGLVIGTHVAARVDAVGMKYGIPSYQAIEFLRSCGLNVGGLVRESEQNPKCPNPTCGSRNTDVVNGIAHCNSCDREWGVGEPTFGRK